MSNIHPIFDDILRRELATIDRSFDLLQDALRPRCAAMGFPASGENVVCQLDPDHEGRHWADMPGFGPQEWDDVPVLDPDMQRKAMADDRDYYDERAAERDGGESHV